MNDPPSHSCPHCGSHQLVAHQSSRKVYINLDGESIPLLTAHFSLDHPVIERDDVTYTCTCSWTGSNPEQAE